MIWPVFKSLAGGRDFKKEAGLKSEFSQSPTTVIFDWVQK